MADIRWNLTLNSDLNDSLESFAKESGVPKSSIMRLALVYLFRAFSQPLDSNSVSLLLKEIELDMERAQHERD